MLKPKIIFCDYCDRIIYKPHGNQKWHHECNYNVRKKRSIEQYARDKLLGDPYWLNERILREQFYGSVEHAEIDPDILEKAGFNFNLFTSEKKRRGQLIFRIHKFGFKFLQNKKIIVCKL